MLCNNAYIHTNSCHVTLAQSINKVIKTLINLFIVLARRIHQGRTHTERLTIRAFSASDNTDIVHAHGSQLVKFKVQASTVTAFQAAHVDTMPVVDATDKVRAAVQGEASFGGLDKAVIALGMLLVDSLLQDVEGLVKTNAS